MRVRAQEEPEEGVAQVQRDDVALVAHFVDLAEHARRHEAAAWRDGPSGLVDVLGADRETPSAASLFYEEREAVGGRVVWHFHDLLEAFPCGKHLRVLRGGDVARTARLKGNRGWFLHDVEFDERRVWCRSETGRIFAEESAAT